MSTKKIAIIYIVAAFGLWVGDAFIDSFVFRQGSFPDLLLFRMSPHELYVRLLIIACLVIVGITISRVILKRNLALDAFRESADTLHTIADAAKDAIVMMDDQGNISFWNPAAENIFGHAPHEAVGRNLHQLLAPQRYHEAYERGFSGFQASGEGPAVGKTLELAAVRKNGLEFPVELSLSALPLKEKWYAVAVIRDITDRKKAEEDLRKHREQLEHLVEERTEEIHAANELLRKEIHDRTRTEEELYRSESFLSTIFDSFHDPFSIIDRDYKIVKYNAAFARARDKRATDLYGKKCYEVLYDRTSACDECVVVKTFQSKDPCAKEKRLTLPDGSSAWVDIYTYPIFDQAGNVSHVVEYTRDITDRKKEEEEKKRLIKSLNRLSTTDGLTGLLNRRALNDMLMHEIARAGRSNADLSMILCDVDRFKQINDTFGHTAGDRALKAVSETLQRTVRETDILGRYGGDEFMIILPETPLAGAKILAEKIRAAIEELDLELPGSRRIRLSISLGVASCCTPADDIDTLVALADTALYTSKNAGRNTVSAMER